MTAEDFSYLGAIYLYADSLLAIELGISIDNIGIRRHLMCSIALCTTGALLLISAKSLIMVLFSRFLTGAGSAVLLCQRQKLRLFTCPPASADYLWAQRSRSAR